MSNEALDQERPEVLPNQVICDNCWAITDRSNAIFWAYFKFKFLKSVDVCPDCLPEISPKLISLQEANL
jgi:hypothetical protein